MSTQRTNGHTVSRLTVHVVWSTKYRYKVLEGDIQKRCRKLLIQICDSEDVTILKGVVSCDHIHMRTSRRLQQEFPKLKKKYWGRHFWAIGFGCWSTGNITDKMVNNYLDHHRKSTNDSDNFILE